MIEENNYEYLKRLLNESIYEAFGNRNVADDEFDSDEDDIEYTSDSQDDNEQNTKETQKSKGLNSGRGMAYKHHTPGSIKSAAEKQLMQKRNKLAGTSNVGYDQKTIDSIWNVNNGIENKYNKSEKDVLEPDMFGRIKVKSTTTSNPKHYKFPIVVISMLNIAPEDCTKIFEKFHKMGRTEKVTIARTRENNTKDGVSFIVAEQYVDEWMNTDLNEIIKFISEFKNEDGTSKYFKNESEVENLRQYVQSRVEKSVDMSDYMSTAKKNNIELFNAFIEAENDEQVNAFIKMYQRYGIINSLCAEAGLSVTFGKILSVQNASLVLGSGRLSGAGQKPTFILTEKMWYRLFKRRVNPNAKPFYIFIPKQSGDITMKQREFTSKPYMAKNADNQDVEISSTSDVLNTFFMGKKWDELTNQQKISASIMCNYINPSNCWPLAEYDVSDTTLIDPNVDPFTKEMGLVNRFTGEFNQAAMDFVKTQNLLSGNKNASEGSSNGEENDDEYLDAFNIDADKRNEYALNKLTEYCTAKGLKFENDTNDISKSIINAMRSIARGFISLQKDSNVSILINDAVYASCMVLKVALDLVGSLKSLIGKPKSEIEFSQYFTAFSHIIEAANGTWKDNEYVSQKKQVSESKEFNPFKKYSKQELLKLANEMLNENCIALNEFNSLLERMNNSKTNLKY